MGLVNKSQMLFLLDQREREREREREKERFIRNDLFESSCFVIKMFHNNSQQSLFFNNWPEFYIDHTSTVKNIDYNN